MIPDRRTFLRMLAVGCGSLTAALAADRLPASCGWARALLSPDVAQAADPNLVWVEGQDPYKNTVRALKELGGMSRFLKKGQRVTLLPNIGWARKPEHAATTHPQVVKALIDMCQDAGAKSVSVFCNPCNDMRICLDMSGIGSVIENSQARFEYINNKGWIKRKGPKGCTHLASAEVYRLIEDCDLLINCPIAKHHGGSQLTMCCKNLMGAVRDRGFIHQALHEGIADLTLMIPHKLCVLDATRILLRNGPTGGNVKDTAVRNTIIAGTNPVEVDVLGTTLFSQQPKEIGYLRILGERKFATIDPAKLSYQRVKA